MDDVELSFTSASELYRLFRSKAVSPVEVTQAALRRIAEANPILNAYVTVTGDVALAQARAAEVRAMRGELIGPLDGIPYSLKDLELTAGIRTAMGSKFFEHHVPTQDGILAAKLKRSGAVLLGKTSTPHLGYKDMSDSLINPPCQNPWKIGMTAGGSSGGAAAAVAGGLGPVSTGSDSAGSIRLPAALCGVFGLKPSMGRVPRYPNADYWGRSHNGPIARTVRDGAMLLQAMSGADPRDPLSLDSSAMDFVAACDGDLTGVRIAWSASLDHFAADRDVQRLAETAALRFSDLGAAVEDVRVGWQSPNDFHRAIYEVGISARHSERAARRPDWIEPTLMQMVVRGGRISANEYARALVARTAFYDEVRAFFEKFDLLLTPVNPIGAWPAQPEPIEGVLDAASGRSWDMFERLAFCYPFNLTGHPAASVPCGFMREGLPVGLQIVGGWRQDGLVLRAAAAFEALQPWTHLRPSLAFEQSRENAMDGDLYKAC